MKGTGGGGGTTGAKWLALFHGVMQRDISAGSERLPGSSLGERYQNKEEMGKHLQKHLFRRPEPPGKQAAHQIRR